MQATSKAATRDKLEELHRALSEALASELCNVPRCPSCGRQFNRPAVLDVIQRFLKSNGIQADGASLADMKKNLEELRDLELPFPTKGKTDDEDT